jgi:hypothetical protein
VSLNSKAGRLSEDTRHGIIFKNPDGRLPLEKMLVGQLVDVFIDARQTE